MNGEKLAARHCWAMAGTHVAGQCSKVFVKLRTLFVDV
jgi:hypothetical protein